MKTVFNPLYLVLVFLSLVATLKGQTPCAGTPGTNSVLPLSHTVCAGSIASMSLANSYTTTGITYQWYTSTISSLGPFSAIAGATLNTYSSAALTANAYYQVVITCTNDISSLSVLHTVSVVPCNTPCNGTPAGTSVVPASQTLCAGDVASFSLGTTYTNTGITYQWGSGSAPGGPFSAIPAATLSSFTSTSLSTGNSYYNVIITCTNSSLSYSTTSAVSVISCTYCSGTPASNTVLPASQTICAGAVASMSLANTYTNSGITYQWQSNSFSSTGPYTSIPGATLSTYTSGPLNSATYYNVLITCTNSSLSISVPYSVNVVACNSPCSGSPASNTILPLSHTVCVGDAASMSLASTYTDSGIVYQWGSSTSPTGPFTAVAGATLSSYTSIPLNANTYFSVVITCTNSQNSYTVTHLVSVRNCTYCSGTPAANSILPATYTLCSGNVANLSLANSYPVSGITYQWQSSTLSSAGPYTPVSNATLSAYSSPSLTADTYFSVIITCTNSGASIMPARSVFVFTCTETGFNNLSFQDPELVIYPNPNTGDFTITSKVPAEAALSLMDLTGRILFTGYYTGTDMKVDMKALPGGIYYLQLQTATGTRAIKVFKE